MLTSHLGTEAGKLVSEPASTWRAAHFPMADMTSLNRQLHVAIHSQDVSAAKEAIAAGASVHSCNGEGVPALHAAMSCTCAMDMVKMLLEAGAEVNRGRDEDGRTSLHVAYDEGLDLEVVEALLSAGADPNHGDIDGWTPLHCACYMGSACYLGSLVQHGAEVNCVNGSGQTPLLLACESCGSQWVGRDIDYAETVKILLDSSADVNVKDPCGDTPLLMAVRAGKPDVAELLCTRGADVNARSGQISGCVTALHLCSAMGDISTVRTLLASPGIDIEVEETQQGLTPLMIAAQSGQLGVALLLLEAGANPQHASLPGLTAVHYAAQEGHANVLSALLRPLLGVVPSLPTSGTAPSALHLACHGGHADAVQVLLASGLDACTIDANHDTPLHIAVRANHAPVVEILMNNVSTKLAAGLKNRRGQAPGDLAVPDSEVAKLLNSAC